jgi:hypothetical protein
MLDLMPVIMKFGIAKLPPKIITTSRRSAPWHGLSRSTLEEVAKAAAFQRPLAL